MGTLEDAREQHFKDQEKIKQLEQAKEELTRRIENQVNTIRGQAEQIAAMNEELKRFRGQAAVIRALSNKIKDYERVLNTPIINDFMVALPMEAAHQQHKWSDEHDAGKNCLDWFWLIGYLSQKIVVYEMADNREKALHHCITTAAALYNWYRHLKDDPGANMRPGIAEPENGG